MKECEICEKDFKDGMVKEYFLKIGVRMGSLIHSTLIDPISLQICFECSKDKKKIIDKYIELLGNYKL